jgi:hypothetical protein
VDSKPLNEMIQKERIKVLNKKGIKKGAYVPLKQSVPAVQSLSPDFDSFDK